MEHQEENSWPPPAEPESDGVLNQLLRMADFAPSKHTADFLRQVYAKERLKRLFSTGQ